MRKLARVVRWYIGNIKQQASATPPHSFPPKKHVCVRARVLFDVFESMLLFLFVSHQTETVTRTLTHKKKHFVFLEWPPVFTVKEPRVDIWNLNTLSHRTKLRCVTEESKNGKKVIINENHFFETLSRERKKPSQATQKLVGTGSKEAQQVFLFDLVWIEFPIVL